MHKRGGKGGRRKAEERYPKAARNESGSSFAKRPRGNRKRPHAKKEKTIGQLRFPAQPVSGRVLQNKTVHQVGKRHCSGLESAAHLTPSRKRGEKRKKRKERVSQQQRERKRGGGMKGKHYFEQTGRKDAP